MRAWIPPNFTDNGNWLGGLVKKQNAVEAGIFLGVLILTLRALLNVIGATAVIIIAIVIGLPITLFLVIGIGGESVMTFVKDLILYKKSKRVVTIKMPTIETEIKKDRKGKK